MAKKKAAPALPPPPGWTIGHEIIVNGRHVTPGTELKIAGERGRFRFVKHVKTDKGAEWIDVVGGPTGHVRDRSFHLDRVKTVHRKSKMRPPKA